MRLDRQRSERGAAATELALLAPVVLLVVAMLVAGARVWFARAAVADAAYAAARAATLEWSAGPARTTGEAIARSELSGVPCAQHTVALDLSGFAVSVGQPARVTATITCEVQLSDLFGVGMPGSFSVDATRASALDTYRRRQ